MTFPTCVLAVSEKDPPDVLNRIKCLEYLAALRHAKWFQVKNVKKNFFKDSSELHLIF